MLKPNFGFNFDNQTPVNLKKHLQQFFYAKLITKIKCYTLFFMLAKIDIVIIIDEND